MSQVPIDDLEIEAWKRVHTAGGGGGGSPTPELLWYKLNEGTGTTAADSSTNANTGNLGTGATWGTGASGSGHCLIGDGTHRALVSGSNVAYGVNKISVCAWIYIVAYPGSGVTEVLDSYNSIGLPSTVGFRVDIDNNLAIYGRIAGGFTQSYRLITPATGAWHHYAYLFDNSTSTSAITLYQDNVLQTGSTFFDATGTANFQTNLLSIGGIAGDLDDASVRVDDVRIYNRLITTGEIAQIYADSQ